MLRLSQRCSSWRRADTAPRACADRASAQPHRRLAAAQPSACASAPTADAAGAVPRRRNAHLRRLVVALSGRRHGGHHRSSEKKPSRNSTAYHIVAEGRPRAARRAALSALLQDGHAARQLRRCCRSGRRSTPTRNARQAARRSTRFDRAEAARRLRAARPTPPIKDDFAVPATGPGRPGDALRASRARAPGRRHASPSRSPTTARSTPSSVDVGASERVTVPFGDDGRLEPAASASRTPTKQAGLARTSASGSRPTRAGCR